MHELFRPITIKVSHYGREPQGLCDAAALRIAALVLVLVVDVASKEAHVLKVVQAESGTYENYPLVLY